ncbi:hypothetical protein ACXZ65_33970 [Streptomyces aculeolatus]
MIRIRAQLSADGRAVRIPLGDRFAPVVDDLATAYADDPDAVGRLLLAHARAVAHLDHAVTAEDATDYDRAMCAAEADGTREALLDESPAAAHLDAVLGDREAVRLADDLTARAARTRLTSQNGTAA